MLTRTKILKCLIPATALLALAACGGNSNDVILLEDKPATAINATIGNSITLAEITTLQTAWGEGLVAISTAYAAGGDYASIAQNVLILYTDMSMELSCLSLQSRKKFHSGSRKPVPRPISLAE